MVLDYRNTAQLDTPRYISFVSPSETASAKWIKENVPADTVIQAFPNRSPRGFFSLLPTFASRRTALGDPMHSRIFQIDPGRLEKRRAAVQKLWESADPREKLRLAQSLGIDYLYVGIPERRQYGEALRQMHYFATVYENSAVTVHQTIPAVEILPDGGTDGLILVGNEPFKVRTAGIYRQNTDGTLKRVRSVEIEPGTRVKIEPCDDEVIYLYPSRSRLGIDPVIDLGDPDLSSTGYPVIHSIHGPLRQATEDYPPGIIAKKSGVMIAPGITELQIRYQAMEEGDRPSFWQVFHRGSQRTLSRQVLSLQADMGLNGSLEPLVLNSETWMLVDIEVHYGGSGVLTVDEIHQIWMPDESDVKDGISVRLSASGQVSDS